MEVPMSHASALVIGLAAGLLLAAAPAAAAPKCTAAQGQAFIDQGRYRDAIREFSCVIAADPTGVDGYRGRIEAELLLGRFSDAVRDYTRVTAFVEPVHPDAEAIIYGGYAARLAAAPTDLPALTGASFARWYFFDYGYAIHLLNRLLAVAPDDPYGNLFRGSSRLLRGATRAEGAADLERAIGLAPASPDVRFVVADAYTYGTEPDPARAFAEATLALDGGLDTPRVHAILASALLAFGERLAAAAHIARHFELVTTELVATPPLDAGESLSLDAVPGRTFEIPLDVAAGETIAIATGGDFWDTILVVLAPDGTPVLGSDDFKAYLAGFEWVAEQTGTYRMLVSSFEAVGTGELIVARD
jgi:tetratricopeptide (TPR) repeat protein